MKEDIKNFYNKNRENIHVLLFLYYSCGVFSMFLINKYVAVTLFISISSLYLYLLFIGTDRLKNRFHKMNTICFYAIVTHFIAYSFIMTSYLFYESEQDFILNSLFFNNEINPYNFHIYIISLIPHALINFSIEADKNGWFDNKKIKNK